MILNVCLLKSSCKVLCPFVCKKKKLKTQKSRKRVMGWSRCMISCVCRPEGICELSFSVGYTGPYIATTRFLSGCERTLSVLDTKDLCHYPD